MSRMVFRSGMPASASELYEWHARGGAFERLVPPWQTVSVMDRVGGIEDGARLYMRIAMGPLRLRWVAVHADVVAGREFTDIQEHGPFAQWRHRHRFEPTGASPDETRSMLTDEIDYRLPLEPVSRWVAGRGVRDDLQRMFAFRHARTRRDLLRHSAVAGAGRRVVVSGSTGMIGSALCAFLTTGGYEVIRLVRRPGRPRLDGTREVRWAPEIGRLDPGALEGAYAVVHLAGAPIAARRWSSARREEIRRSRVDGTLTIARAIAACSDRPPVLISASGVGYYGDREEEVTEASPSGEGFLAATAREWEAATHVAADAGVRVVKLRFGVVLGAGGGLLRRLLTSYRLGLGGPVGGGGQPLSWISLDDAVGSIHHALNSPDCEGAINVVAPRPATQREFSRVLGQVLRRPAVLPIPGAAVRVAFGQMGVALVLGGAPVRSEVLHATGFLHQDADLASALRFELGMRRFDEGSPS